MPRFALVVALLLGAVAAAVPAFASAAQPAALFNASGQNHVLACVPLASSPADLRFSDGTPTGFQLTNDLTFNDGRCPSNTVRLDLHEVFPVGSERLVFHRGGNGYTDEPNTKYGQLRTSDIAGAADVVPSGGGRGAPCAALASEPAYEVKVASIPAEMHYKHPSELPNGSNRGSSFEHYGDPGADQGSVTTIHYTYLLWSFVNVGGGGIVRILLQPDQVVRACDVDSVTMSSWDRAGNVNGSVTARYVQTLVGNCRVYGWMVWSHDYALDADPPTPHYAPAASPPPEAQPDATCPVAAGALPPTVSTGDATSAQDGTASLRGNVHPEGTPTRYRFEWGSGPEYGNVTDERSVSVAMRDNAVSGQLAGLQPSTSYHYRIVATGEHGTSAGVNRTFTTPDPPPPPAPPPPPPPPPPVELTGLQLTPAAMKRSRHRLGSSARISYALTRPATVTLTFRRAVTGMLVGTRCKTAPTRGIPRGRKRCTRWLDVPGSLTQQAPAGESKLRFGGWIGRRALASGRYRVQALPVEPGGPASVMRAAGFRIR